MVRRASNYIDQLDREASEKRKEKELMIHEGWEEFDSVRYGRFSLKEELLPEPGAVAHTCGRLPTLQSIFCTLFPEPLFQKIIEFHAARDEKSVMKKDSNSVVYSYSDMLSYMSVRIHIQSQQYVFNKGASKKPLVELWNSKIIPHFGIRLHCISRDNYSRMLANLWIPTTFARN